jgi:hypothetical protein
MLQSERHHLILKKTCRKRHVGDAFLLDDDDDEILANVQAPEPIDDVDLTEVEDYLQHSQLN